MSIARVTEIKASSTESFDDAIKAGVVRAHKPLKNVKAAWIENQEVLGEMCIPPNDLVSSPIDLLL